MNRSLTIAVLVLCVGLVGCASTRKICQPIQIETRPTGAEIFLNSKSLGDSPQNTTVIYEYIDGICISKSTEVLALKEGYHQHSKTIQPPNLEDPVTKVLMKRGKTFPTENVLLILEADGK